MQSSALPCPALPSPPLPSLPLFPSSLLLLLFFDAGSCYVPILLPQPPCPQCWLCRLPPAFFDVTTEPFFFLFGINCSAGGKSTADPLKVLPYPSGAGEDADGAEPQEGSSGAGASCQHQRQELRGGSSQSQGQRATCTCQAVPNWGPAGGAT